MAVTLDWRKAHRPAMLQLKTSNGEVQCGLCPRGCMMSDGQLGFCGVRGNREGHLVTYTYGQGVHLTEEVVETEAVYHYAPGARTLSLGNIGCMLHCSYCQNWQTSQSRLVREQDIQGFTPEQVIETAINHGLKVLSWTYNDPVVWQEFVVETATMAKEAGLINLYKSAFFIRPEAIEQLIPCIDIFSVSLKAISDAYYRKYTSGWLQPVLDGTKQVLQSGRHLEVSNLMLTDISDDEESARRMADWVLTNLGSKVPTHYVRFHPAYKLTETVRTPEDRLYRARELAQRMGIEHVYVGNVANEAVASTFCSGCGSLLVRRFGLKATPLGVDQRGVCKKCGRDAHIIMVQTAAAPTKAPPRELRTHIHRWNGEITSMHVQCKNESAQPQTVYYRPAVPADGAGAWTALPLAPGESYRFIVAKAGENEAGVELAVPECMNWQVMECLDRAHFPVC